MRVKDAVGRFGEETAAKHLDAAGLTSWTATGVAPGRGWASGGELDLIAREGDALVVVEVKTALGHRLRRPGRGGDRGQGASHPASCGAWLAAHSGTDAAPEGRDSYRGSRGHSIVRFDVVSVLRGARGLTVEHLRGAF